MTVISRVIFAGRKESFQPLNGIDTALPGFATYIFLYDDALCDERLIKSLEKALHLNPYFSGRLKNINTAEPIITACDSGVLFATESYDENILCFHSNNSPYMERSYIKPDIFFVDEYTPVLQIKLSKYRNGSILGVSFHHNVCDGQSFFNFLHNWGKLARGEQPNEVVFNRRLVKELAIGDGVQPAEKFPVVKVGREWAPPKTKSAIKNFRLTAGFIKQLLKNAKSNGVKESVGLETNLWIAYLWKLIDSVQTSDGQFPLVQIYNTRALLNLPKGYFGNTVAFPILQLEGEELVDIPLEAITKYIQLSYYQLIRNADQFRKDIAFWDTLKHERKVTQYRHQALKLLEEGRAIVINNLTTQPIYDLDFGSGVPIWTDFPNRGLAIRYVQALPAPEKNGDIILLVSLPDAEMAEFSKHLTPIPSS